MPSAASAQLPHFIIRDGSQPRGVRPLGEGANDEALAAGRMDKLRRELLAQAQADLERARAADRAAHEAELAALEGQLREQTAAAIHGRLAAGLEEIKRHLAEEVARSLARFFESAVRERALGELAATVTALLARKGGAGVRLSGPVELLDVLRARLPAYRDEMAFETVAGALDVTVLIDHTVIRTAIANWTARLAAAVGEGGDGHGGHG